MHASIVAKFVLDASTQNTLAPHRLDALLQRSAAVFRQVYNPQNKRLGVRFLERQPFGPSFLGYWPNTIRETLEQTPTAHNVVADAAVSLFYT